MHLATTRPGDLRADLEDRQEGTVGRDSWGRSPDMSAWRMKLLAECMPLLNGLRSAGGRWIGGNSPLAHGIRRHRLAFCLILCGGLSAVSFSLSFVIRFELSSLLQPHVPWYGWFLKTLPLVVGLRVLAFLYFRLHRVSWARASVRDVLPVTGAVLASSLVIIPAVLIAWNSEFPRSILVVDMLLCLLLVSGARYSYRIGAELLTALGAGRRHKVIVIGAGSAGDLTVRALLGNPRADYWPVAILDDDPYKKGTTMHGVPVMGPVSAVAEVAQRTNAAAIVLALPTASSGQIYRAVGLCRQTGLPIKTIPDYEQIMRGSQVASRIQDFRVEDLLHRRPVTTEVPEIQRFLRGRAVLVTGAAGSIGSELCRQIVEQDVARELICLDKDENGLFRLEHRLRELKRGVKLTFFLGDVRERSRMAQLFTGYAPDIVFHAAAYKHVPILQHHPVEAVRNNIGGTRTLVDLADEHRVSNFVLISTDKAVNPTSVMGATKRIAEKIVRARDLTSKTRFSVIRFGNVLGSNGSVVELFQGQIRENRPVTVTHPDIERYFMTIPEAVHLVLFAATMGQGGEVFILDMGEPVRIDHLARNIIQLSGLTPDVDVPIVYTGLRPGEKLFEELWTPKERPQPTSHPGILMAAGSMRRGPDITKLVTELLVAGEENDLQGCWSGILGLVPSFQGRTQDHAVVPPDREVRPGADDAEPGRAA